MSHDYSVGKTAESSTNVRNMLTCDMCLQLMCLFCFFSSDVSGVISLISCMLVDEQGGGASVDADMSIWAFTVPELPSLTTLTQEECSFNTYLRYICCKRRYQSDQTNIGVILLNKGDFYTHFHALL